MKTRSVFHHDFDLDTVFASLAEESRVLIAVSGGSDSLALLHLLQEWSKSRSRPRLAVATVDHGLRAQSLAEAEKVAETCRSLGLQHVIKFWHGKKPSSALSNMAREARYRLLSRTALEIGATAIVLGHTLNDQHETVLMRAKRLGFTDFANRVDENTPRGLAGIRPTGAYCGSPDYRFVRLLRPLLAIGREELRKVLRDNKIGWSDDPGNEDLKYERARLRADLAATSGVQAGDIARFADCVVLEREALDKKCANFILSHVTIDKFGIVHLEQEKFMGCGPRVGEIVMQVLLAIAGGRDYFVSKSAVFDVIKHIRLVDSANSCGKLTLGSAIIEWQNDQIGLWREYRNLPRRQVLQDRDSILAYDGRIVVALKKRHLDQQLELAALGPDGLAYVEEQSGKRIPCKPRAALWSQPVLHYSGIPVCAPLLSWRDEKFAAGHDWFGWKLWTPALEKFQLHCDRRILAAVNKIRPTSHETGVFSSTLT